MFELSIHHYIPFIALLLGCYFLGNLSPATLVGKMHGVNIRQEGSGNPGTTNVLRTLGYRSAAVTLLVDILKGVAAVLLGQWLFGEAGMYGCGLAVFLGHCLPVAYRFRGGKGIATGFGVAVTVDWRVGLIALVCAALGMLLSRRVSVGSIAAAVSLPVLMLLFHRAWLPVLWAVILAVLVLVRHRSNIQRLLAHEEPPVPFLDRNHHRK